MRRIVMLLTVVALMMVMLAMSVAPAFAAWQTTGPDAGCRTGSTLLPNSAGTLYYLTDKNGNGFVCATTVGGGSNEHIRIYDDRPVA